MKGVTSRLVATAAVAAVLALTACSSEESLLGEPVPAPKEQVTAIEVDLRELARLALEEAQRAGSDVELSESPTDEDTLDVLAPGGGADLERVSTVTFTATADDGEILYTGWVKDGEPCVEAAWQGQASYKLSSVDGELTEGACGPFLES